MLTRSVTQRVLKALRVKCLHASPPCSCRLLHLIEGALVVVETPQLVNKALHVRYDHKR